jgi:hypothetical protein
LRSIQIVNIKFFLLLLLRKTTKWRVKFVKVIFNSTLFKVCYKIRGVLKRKIMINCSRLYIFSSKGKIWKQDKAVLLKIEKTASKGCLKHAPLRETLVCKNKNLCFSGFLHRKHKGSIFRDLFSLSFWY